MAGGEDWDPQKIFDLYLYDYLLKKNFRHTAEIFRKEANVPRKRAEISTPDGFLNEWFRLFYETYLSRQQAAGENPPDMGENIELPPLPESLTLPPEFMPYMSPHQQQQNWIQGQQLVLRDEQNMPFILPEFAMNYQQMPGPFPFSPEHMRLEQASPFLFPTPSPEQQQNWIQDQQLVLRDEQNMPFILSEFAMNYQQMPGPFPFYPEHMRSEQESPFLFPTPSSQQQQNWNQQLPERQNQIGNNTHGRSSKGIPQEAKEKASDKQNQIGKSTPGASSKGIHQEAKGKTSDKDMKLGPQRTFLSPKPSSQRQRHIPLELTMGIGNSIRGPSSKGIHQEAKEKNSDKLGPRKTFLSPKPSSQRQRHLPLEFPILESGSTFGIGNITHGPSSKGIHQEAKAKTSDKDEQNQVQNISNTAHQLGPRTTFLSPKPSSQRQPHLKQGQQLVQNRIGNSTSGPSSKGIHQETMEKNSDKDERNEEQNISSTAHQFPIDHMQMAATFPSPPQYMMSGQRRPWLSPNPSSQRQRHLNQGQLVMRAPMGSAIVESGSTIRIGNSTPGPSSKGIHQETMEKNSDKDERNEEQNISSTAHQFPIDHMQMAATFPSPPQYMMSGQRRPWLSPNPSSQRQRHLNQGQLVMRAPMGSAIVESGSTIRIGNSTPGPSSMGIHQEGKEKSPDKDEQNISNTVEQLCIHYPVMPETCFFSPEYMRLVQSMPFPLPDTSSQQQQNWNQSQQFIQDRIGNSIPGPYTMVINHVGAQRGTFPLSRSCDAAGANEGVNPFPPNIWLLNSPRPAPYRPQFPRLMEQSQQNMLGQSIRVTYGDMTPTFPRSSANFSRQQPMLPESNLSGKEAQNIKKRSKLVYPVAGEDTLGHADAEVDKHVDEVESFLSAIVNDDKESNPLGFTFQEIGCLHSSKSKVLCCHFSSDGRLLASAGHEKKVCVWDMDAYDYTYSSEVHSLLITDIRFRPNSTILATSSYDRTLQIWDAAKPSKSLFKLHGHNEQVLALDFHPRKVDLLCSCDIGGEIRLWNVNHGACVNVSKGASKQVRFQPQTGKLLATATGNNINIIDSEIQSSVLCNLKGHTKEVLCLCWDKSGKYLASVSEDSARIWSLVSGGSCIHELQADGNKFQSCIFHPGYSLLLIIGSYQSLELWNPTEDSKTWSVAAHDGLISALADSPQNEMIASASHDRCIKIWKY